MSTSLITDEQLAEDFGISVDRLHELRRRNHWPCVRLSRFEVRFTADQVAQIVAQQTERKTETDAISAPAAGLASVPSLTEGQTKRSAARSKARTSPASTARTTGS